MVGCGVVGCTRILRGWLSETEAERVGGKKGFFQLKEVSLFAPLLTE
jgi:hypothetical protein